MDDTIYVQYGWTIDDLFDRYGESAMIMAAVFEVDCQCGDNYRLEPDGYCTCDNCGHVVKSPLLEAGLI